MRWHKPSIIGRRTSNAWKRDMQSPGGLDLMNEDSGESRRRLDLFTPTGTVKGRSLVVRALWLAASALLVEPWYSTSAVRSTTLRAFGASVGSNVVIRRGVRVHQPWKLAVGSNVWL